MSTEHPIRIEPLTEEAFAPFGEILAAKDRTPDFATPSGTRGWAVDFRAGRPLILMTETPHRGLCFTRLERHFNVSQTFLPMGGAPAVVAVAPPSLDRADPPPACEAVRAFLLDGTCGYLLRRGTWHSLDRMPLYGPATRWAMITDHETQNDLSAEEGGSGEMALTEEVDYQSRFGVTFLLTLGA